MVFHTVQWLTYLKPSHVHIDKQGDFIINLELHEDQLNAGHCSSCTGGSAKVSTCLKIVLSMLDIGVCQKKEDPLKLSISRLSTELCEFNMVTLVGWHFF